MALRVGVLTDLHHVQDPSRRGRWINRYDFAGVVERCERAVELFTREGVSRVLLLGDLAHDGDLASVRQIVRAAKSSVPLLAVGGNHDSPDPTKRIAAAGRDRVQLPGWRALGPDSGPAGRPAACAPRRAALGGGPPARPDDLERLAGPAGQPLPRSLAPARDHRARPAVCRRPRRPRGRRAGPGRARRPDGGRLRAPPRALQRGLGPAASAGPWRTRRAAVRRDGARAGAHGRGLEVVRRARELDEVRERRDPRLAPAQEAWRFEPGRGWRRG